MRPPRPFIDQHLIPSSTPSFPSYLCFFISIHLHFTISLSCYQAMSQIPFMVILACFREASNLCFSCCILTQTLHNPSLISPLTVLVLLLVHRSFRSALCASDANQCSHREIGRSSAYNFRLDQLFTIQIPHWVCLVSTTSGLPNLSREDMQEDGKIKSELKFE